MIKKIILFLWAGMIVGCSVGPNYERPQIYNDQNLALSLNLQSGNAAVPTQEWYKSFGDETLNSLIDDTIKNSPDLAIAKERLQQARFNLGIARAAFGPEISTSGNYNKSDTFATPETKSKESFYQVGFDASWEIDIWGQTRRLNESQYAAMKGAAADLKYARIILTAETAANYINYRQYEKLLQITERNLKLQQDIYDIIHKKHSAGLADDLALEQAKSAVLMTKAQIPSLRANLNSYQNALATLSGKLPFQVELSNSNILTKTPQISLESLHQIPIEVIRMRPDVIAAEQNLIAQNALIGNKIAAMLPNLSLSGFLGWQNHTLSPIFASNYQIYNSAANLSLPLWNWNKQLNQVRLQKSATKQAALNYQKSILAAVVDINQAMKNLEEESERNLLTQKNQASQNKILELSLVKYKNGLIEFSDVLTAEQNKLNAEQEYIKSLSNWYIDIISFNKSLGGGLAI